MKRKMLGFLLFVTIVATGITSSAWATSFFVYDAFGGTWHDSDKTWIDDSLMCWAATASNTLAWTGWGYPQSENFANENDIFQYYKNHFQDRRGGAKEGIWWWFDPTPAYWVRTSDVSGGGFWPEYSDFEYSQYGENQYLKMILGGSTTRTTTPLTSLANALQAGQVVMLNISGPYSHAVTLWGYEYESRADGLQDITGLYITDSDDGFNGMQYYQAIEEALRPDFSKVNLIDYNGLASGWRIDSADGLSLTPFGPNTSIPEPATMLLFGLGLLSLAGFSRRKK